MTKVCAGCAVERPLLSFYVKKSGKPTSRCKECIKSESGKWRASNPGKLAAYCRAWRLDNLAKSRAGAKYWAQRNPERKKANDKRWHAENKHLQPIYQAKWNEKNRERVLEMQRRWGRNNPDVVRRKTARRNAAKLNATPRWADQEEIACIYNEAATLTRLTGIEHHVDHIVPLRSKLVCGLHVPDNLQILARQENLAKSNKQWPGMP